MLCLDVYLEFLKNLLSLEFEFIFSYNFVYKYIKSAYYLEGDHSSLEGFENGTCFDVIAKYQIKALRDSMDFVLQISESLSSIKHN